MPPHGIPVPGHCSARYYHDEGAMDSLPSKQGLIAGLSPHQLFHSKDLDETRSNVGRIFKPHVLGVCGPHQRLDAQMHHLAIGGVSLNRLRYGADVTIEPDCLDDFLLVQMPLQGAAHIRCGSGEIDSSSSMASVVTPSLPLHMSWQGQCDQLIVRIERSSLETACALHLGHALPKPLEFQLGMDLRQGAGLAWRNLVLFLASSQFTENAVQYPLLAAQLEQLLVSSLLLGQPHNYHDAMQHRAPTPQPSYIKRAQAYIAEYCDQPVTVADIAKHAAISVRSLHAGFQQHCGTTPMAYVRLVRLQRVREELLEARAGNRQASITQVALVWGFSHFGHFAAAYRRQFNETPSQTLHGPAGSRRTAHQSPG